MASILLVEDNDDHALLAQAALFNSKYKFEIDHSVSAEECLVIIREKDYDAIILDYSLPKKNGLELLKEIKGMSYDAPVVMITSHGDEQIAVEAMKCGAYDYVSKADDYLGKLPQVLQKAIESHRLLKEHAELQARIEKSENRLRNIFENVNVMLIEINDDCSISYGNPKAKSYLKFMGNPDTKPCDLFLKQNGHERDCSECPIRKSFESLKSSSCEIVYNDRQFTGAITITQGTQPSHERIVLVLMDVTEQKELQRKLIQSERIGALGRMASGIAHDFNNILAVILGHAEFMMLSHQNSVNIDIEKELGIIRQVAIDGANTVKRIQEFTRVIKQEKFAILKANNLISDVAKITEPIWKEGSQRDGVKIDLSTELKSGLNIEGSASDLREVLTNMIFNALDAMPEGGNILIKTYDINDCVYISISDTGVGIPSESIDNIFEPFFTSKGIDHSGLGLSVVYGIIGRHNGRIDVNSTLGKGTTFIITLPACKETNEYPEVNEIPHRTQHTNILAIDDEETIIDILDKILTTLGYNVTTAHDGASGIKAFESGKYDIVFTDLGMPNISGWEVAQHVKSANADVKVILLTGWGLQLDENEMKEKNVDFVIAKPFQIDQIAKAVSNLCPSRV